MLVNFTINSYNIIIIIIITLILLYFCLWRVSLHVMFVVFM
jgi:hypothetical protein